MKTKKGDFVEIEFVGYHDEKVFDSNIPEELKKLNPEAKPDNKDSKTVICIGQKMVVPGFDEALEGKEINKDYEIHVLYKDGFGERKRELVKTIPLHIFTEQKMDPKPGATFVMDNLFVRIITVSGARVLTDFNKPLAGKDLDYKFKITRIIQEDKEKAEAIFKFLFRTVPKFEVQEEKIIVKGPKPIEGLVSLYKDKFKEILKKDLVFEELKEEKKEESKN